MQADLHRDGHHSQEVPRSGLKVSLQWKDPGPDPPGQLSDRQAGSSVPALVQQEELPQSGWRYTPTAHSQHGSAGQKTKQSKLYTHPAVLLLPIDGFHRTRWSLVMSITQEVEGVRQASDNDSKTVDEGSEPGSW